jgi:polysaccharide export outer membrane protein
VRIPTRLALALLICWSTAGQAQGRVDTVPAPGQPEIEEGVAAAAGSPAADAQTPSAPQDALLIGAGDVLEIKVFGLEELDRKVRVLADGTISMPLLGSFQLSDLTVPQAEREIARMLSDRQLVNDPQVSVFVEEFGSRGVTVQGAVERPGEYQMSGSSSLLDMIGKAGGFSGSEGKQVIVQRQSKEGDEHQFRIDTEQLISGEDFSLNIALQPGDIVIVQPSRRYRVYVTGAVARPGAIEFSSAEGISVLQAITAAGGPSNRANLRKVTVTRGLADGTQERFQVNVKKIQNGKVNDFPLERNDTVVVGEWFF